MDNIEWLWHWIRTRENVRILKESGALGPWCNDPIISNNHFCNVRREDDRGTKEIRRVVVESGWPLEDLPWIYTMARMFNHPPTVDISLRLIRFKTFNMDWVMELKARAANGEKLFNTAYVVSTCGKSMNKVDYVADVVHSVRHMIVPRNSLEAAHAKLMTVDGLGSFLAGQVVADLKNDRYLADAEDWFSWACMGPGSKKGMDYIYGGGTNHSNFMDRLIRVRGSMPSDIKAMNIHNQDLQNCLCEFSKYMAIKEGTRKRSRPYGGTK